MGSAQLNTFYTYILNKNCQKSCQKPLQIMKGISVSAYSVWTIQWLTLESWYTNFLQLSTSAVQKTYPRQKITDF